ncbi:MAG: thiamine phosphate synthase [Bacteroidia bacterium]|nr:thiamine phosphate synthase [Bacteroidia bacterium]
MNNPISRFHYLTQDLPHFSHEQQAEEACRGGIRWVQLRVKNQLPEVWEITALKVQEICRKYNAIFIMNDNVILAHKINADGVHLGKTDMHPSEARKILGDDKIIGGTANTPEDIIMLAGAKVNYIGLGPFRFTQTKQKLSPVLSTEGYYTILSEIKNSGLNIPVIAIGGIKAEDIPVLMKTGIHGIAASSAINLSPNPTETAKDWVFRLKNYE